jgi:predicted phosphodiesterase
VKRSLVTVFAVEDTSVQLTWPALPAPRVKIDIGGRQAEVEAGPQAMIHIARQIPRPLQVAGGFGGPGALTIAGLAPATRYEVTLSGAGVPSSTVAHFTTLACPPGTPRLRVATLNDIHIGEGTFGVFGTMEDPSPLPAGTEPHAMRAARAALAEAVAWGAEVVIVKGDLTRTSEDAEFHEVGRLFASSPIPVMAVLGNHDVHPGSDGPGVLATHGLSVATEAVATDLPGLRVVLGHSPSPVTKRGIVEDDQRRRVVQLAGAAEGAALVVFHHQPHGTPLSRCYPPGIDRRSATDLLDALAEANPATLVTAGHTHRHRARRHGPLIITETGSPKDYPGTWTGYAISDGGIRQVVRRVAAPDVIRWTEVTGRAMGGVWRRWSPGTLDERCFTHPWPPQAR